MRKLNGLNYAKTKVRINSSRTSMNGYITKEKLC